jgi:hypothetical protein
MFIWILFLIFFFLALLHSAWWWIPTVLLGLQRVLVIRRHRKPWWSIQDQALNVYARAAAEEKVAAERENRDFEAQKAIALMLAQLRSNWDTSQIDDFIFQQMDSRRLSNIEAVMKCLLARRPKATESEKEELLQMVKESFTHPSASLQVRIIIAGLIEEQLGLLHQGDYLYQAVLGNV